MSPKEDAPKRAAIDLDDVAGKRLTEISAAEFLQLLEQVQAGAYPPPSDEATVGDVLAGAASAQRLGAGGLPEKKKLERETFPEKKKVELEKPDIEKQSVEPPSDLATTMSQFDDRLATIEQQLSKLST